MQIFILIAELIGTVAFALSGAMTAIKKGMDLLGICMLGFTTAVGGGIFRDLILGITPPSAFNNPIYFILSVAVSIVAFLPFVRSFFKTDHRYFDWILLVSDSIGLGVFTMIGLKVAMDSGFSGNGFLVIFVAVATGVGGGVVRDIFADDQPYIFVKHIYASASIAGAIVCYFLFAVLPQNWSMIIGFIVIILIRFISAKLRLSLPRAKAETEE